jgi:hypothetical protein
MSMAKSYADYIAMGMDERAARYFSMGRRRIRTAEPQEGHRIVLTFDNGERRILDCSSKLTEGSIFQKVAAPEDFNRVFVDENGNLAWDIDPTVDSAKIWNNRIDFCRDACYLESSAI